MYGKDNFSDSAVDQSAFARSSLWEGGGSRGMGPLTRECATFRDQNTAQAGTGPRGTKTLLQNLENSERV